MKPITEGLVRSLSLKVESQLRAGSDDAVERVLAEHPELQSDIEAALDLIYVEITTREEMGKPVSRGELGQRFPHWNARIDRLMAVHRALSMEGNTGTSDTIVSHEDTNAGDTAEHPHLVQRSVGKYELLDELGRGGMGVVYRARQVGLNRIVAIKLIPEILGSEHNSRRLIQEAMTVARLDHPRIARVYDAGYDEGMPFICFEYIAGGSLAEKLSGGTYEANAAAGLLLQLTEAMQYAHEKGIIHRDLKPANILLASSGSPKIADFGLAKSILEQPTDDRRERLTRTGELLGSLCYMSPEQVSGHDARIGVTTDIYGLGTILYEVLTGRPPHLRESALETARDIQYSEPISPRTLVATLPRDIESICLKCLRKSPDSRYADAAELADDLERFLAGKPTKARPVSRFARAVTWSRRQPATAALITAAVVLPVCFGMQQSNYARKIAASASQLDVALANEQQARQIADRQFWRAYDSVAGVQRQWASSGLRHEPRMQQARLDVVDEGLTIIEGLGKDRPDEARIRSERANLHKLRGHILMEIGRQEEALTEFELSISIYQELLKDAPEDIRWNHSLAAAHGGKAETLKWLGDGHLATKNYAIGVNKLRALATQQPNDSNLQHDFVQALSGWTSMLINSGQHELAGELLTEADRFSKDNLGHWPDSPRSHSLRAQIKWAEGRLARDRSDNQHAESCAANAIVHFEQALELAPGDRDYQNFLVETLLFQASQLQALHRYAQARPPLQRVEALLGDLKGRYPSIDRYDELRILLMQEWSLLEVNVGNDELAIQWAEEVLATRRELVRRSTSDARDSLAFAGSLADMANRIIGTEMMGQERFVQAEEYAREALSIAKEGDFEESAKRKLLWFSQYNLVVALARQDRIDEARQCAQLLSNVTTHNSIELRFLADAWSEIAAATQRSGTQSEVKEATLRTIQELQKAVDQGYRDVTELENAESLKPFQSDPRFQDLLDGAREKRTRSAR